MPENGSATIDLAQTDREILKRAYEKAREMHDYDGPDGAVATHTQLDGVVPGSEEDIEQQRMDFYHMTSNLDIGGTASREESLRVIIEHFVMNPRYDLLVRELVEPEKHPARVFLHL